MTRASAIAAPHCPDCLMTYEGEPCHLHRAAPDLLAALRRIAALPAHPKNIRAIDIARAALARAAIAKARGE